MKNTHRDLTLMCQARSLLDRSSTFHADRLRGVQVPSSAPRAHRCHCPHAFLVLAPLDGSLLRSWHASLRNDVCEYMRLILRVNTSRAAGTTNLPRTLLETKSELLGIGNECGGYEHAVSRQESISKNLILIFARASIYFFTPRIILRPSSDVNRDDFKHFHVFGGMR